MAEAVDRWKEREAKRERRRQKWDVDVRPVAPLPARGGRADALTTALQEDTTPPKAGTWIVRGDDAAAAATWIY